jgi:hypothetical protein
MPKTRRDTRADPSFRASDIYSFHTAPLPPGIASKTSRYAAIKVLDVKNGEIFYTVLDGIFDAPPSLADVVGRPPLVNTRLAFDGKSACHVNRITDENGLREFRHVGIAPLTDDERALLSGSLAYGSWVSANFAAEGEWRWHNDRDAFVAEMEQFQREREAQWAAESERYHKRLKSLTWEQLLAETPFAGWDDDPAFPPRELVAAARERIRAAVMELQSLGPKPKKAAVRAVLKACVQSFNDMDAAFGPIIETTVREDICEALEELAFVAKHKSLAEEIAEWRDW